MKNEDE